MADNDIAIIGMALRVPGARNTAEFWGNLRGGVESIRTVAPEELIQAGESPERIRRKNYVPRTADLPDMEMFDADFFGLSQKEAAIMDPQHRHFLECAWEAMEDACRPPEGVEGPVGVFAGCGMGSYFYFNVCSHRNLVDQVGMFLLRHTGNDKDFLSTRASYAFDLRGPSINVQTACSTSLVAVHYACQSLLSGECDMALAGGATIELPHRRGYLSQEGEILSPDGHCRAFDHRAAGTVFGSGAGVVVLRRLADAIAEGDPIRAVIRATAINNDGGSKAGYLAPSVSGQAAAVVEALAIADVPADSIQYVECHGTGTYLGDPIEIEALTQAFRQSTRKTGFCRVGSVKTNIGHLDTAAGVVSLIKTALAVEHGEIPPSLGYEKPNPAIPFETSPFLVNDRLTPWPVVSGPRRACVNSLGVGGTNAHAVVEQAPKGHSANSAQSEGGQLLLLSAKSAKALDEAGRRLATFLNANPDVPLSDVAHSLAKGRRHFEHGRAVAVADRRDAIDVLSAVDPRRLQSHSRIDSLSGSVFLFPGGGAQYPGMGRALYKKEPAFRAAVDEGLGYLPPEVAKAIGELWLDESQPDAAIRLLKPSLQLPAILIIEIAIVRLLMSWGVKPAAMIGHSMGENAAACIAGVLSYERAVKLVRLRGELFDEIVGGGMLSVALSVEELQKRLPANLDIASVNAPQLCVVSGANDELDAFRAQLLADEIDANRIPIDIAAHSHQLEPILARFEAFLRQTPLNAPQIPIVSNLTGTWLTHQQATDPLYWTRHLRSTVRFSECMATVATNTSHVYIEVGPGRVLSSLAKAQPNITANQVINALPHADESVDDHLHFMTAIGRCWATGLPIVLDRLWTGETPRRISLPTYPFQHQRYFLDRIAAPAAGNEAEALSKIADMTNWGWRPVWKQSSPDTRLGADDKPASWLVFLSDTPFDTALLSRLRAAGHQVTTVTPGDMFAKLGEGTYSLCDEHGRAGYDALLQDLASNGGLPERIIHLGLVTGEKKFRPGSSFFHRNLERGFYSLFYFGQSLSEQHSGTNIQLTVLTNGMQRVGNETLPYPEKATVLGPAQVLPREQPGLSVRVIDLPMSAEASRSRSRFGNGAGQDAGAATAAAAAIVDRIWDDLFADHGNEIVAYRADRRWKQSYETVPLENAAPGAEPFRQGGVYLLTGGLGDLGMVFARSLASRYSAKLILTGRTELPDRSEWANYLQTYGDADRIGRAIATIRSIEHDGGEVLYARADVTDADALRAVIAEAKSRFGAIHGVLHTAGIVKDELIQLKEPSEIDEVLAPKVLGTLVLAEALAGETLDLIVLFSSTSTDIAPAGQVDYVAANAYLNAFAESRANSQTRIIALHWGIWKDVGLAARAVLHAERGEAGPASIATTNSVFFDRRVRDGEGKEWLEGRWDASRHWLLEEHRLSTGHAVWPGTGYIEVIAHALAEQGVAGPFEISDLTFLRPLHVPDGEARIVRVAVGKQGGGRYGVTIASEVATEQGSGRLLHVEATGRIHRGGSAAKLDLAGLVAGCSDKTIRGNGQALRSAQEEHLRFGPRWKVLRELHLGRRQAIARLALDETFLGDTASGMRLHPALLDIATGYAMELIPGYDPQAGLWVPMSYGRIRVHAALPATIWSHVRLAAADDLGGGYATFDISLADETGQVLVEVEQFTIKRLGRSADFSASLMDTTGAEFDRKATHDASDLSPALARLAAQVEQGIAAEEGLDALVRAVGTGLSQVIVSSMDLPGLQRAALRVESQPAPSIAFERPDLDTDFVGPRNEIEAKLAEFWTELLGVQKIGVHDNFFDLGGHSLIAVRLFRMIKKAYAADFPISVLFEAPTIAKCAELIERSGAKAEIGSDMTAAPAQESSFVHLVPMHLGKNQNETPLFVCAGMFGNILNLRHLAVQIAHDRPVYGLQARGLYGGQAPHETFEEMAHDYLKEVRTVQPEGPYLLSGFSGGGLVAYEMAQQLSAVGESVAILVMLDTPFPEAVPLSVADRIAMKMQDLQRDRSAFLSQWIRKRREWEMQRAREREDEPASAERFHSKDIEAAFRRALDRYRARPYSGDVLLLRPKLRVTYHLRGGRQLDTNRCPLHADNGWSPYIGNLAIVEVPGDHDSMVLEPNVRVLAGHMRKALDQSEWGRYAAIAAE
jgi:acyl transferase domain-containing protein/thioesterase domain-containing protein/NAD(P)-dependent dehydrogenase (short-subunit alcohol dehydrogenase family)/acyl carrier protein